MQVSPLRAMAYLRRRRRYLAGLVYSGEEVAAENFGSAFAGILWIPDGFSREAALNKLHVVLPQAASSLLRPPRCLTVCVAQALTQLNELPAFLHTKW